jgi:hypothetical protein
MLNAVFKQDQKRINLLVLSSTSNLLTDILLYTLQFRVNSQ